VKRLKGEGTSSPINNMARNISTFGTVRDTSADDLVENVVRTEISTGLGFPDMSAEGATGLVGKDVLSWVREIKVVVAGWIGCKDGIIV